MTSDTAPFDFEIPRIVAAVKNAGHTSVLLQFPEGLKRNAIDVAFQLEGQLEDVDVQISGEPCFGACDLPHHPEGLVVNFGHYPIPNLTHEGDVIFIPARSNTDPIPIVRKALPELKGTVGVVSTPQYIHRVSEIVDFLSNNNIIPFVSKGDDRIFKKGQVLGCNISAARSISKDIDMILFIGAGNFHPLALALGTDKDIIIVDPDIAEIRRINDLKDRVLRQRHAVISQAKDAEIFGVILSTKPGQRRQILARDIVKDLRKAGKKAFVVEMENTSPQILDSFSATAWVSTACPRLAIDDHLAYNRPIITPPELDIILGKREWEDYVFDEIV